MIHQRYGCSSIYKLYVEGGFSCKNANFTWYGTTNEAALDLIDKELLEDETINPRRKFVHFVSFIMHLMAIEMCSLIKRGAKWLMH